jgi:16S rRNA (cytidine1402-2'-O)-methyltransferase
MTTIYLVPSFLSEEAIETIPTYVIAAIKNSKIIFAENERTARRFLKSIDKSFVIDDFEWHSIQKEEKETIAEFKTALVSKKNIAIISEAGCPGVADPGQMLIAIAQKENCIIKPLVGPNSILLALMASGMNGQQFEFVGYLPIDNQERIKKIKELEANSSKNNSTKIFIETPYRNNQLLETILQHCHPETKICIGVNISAASESIKTMTVLQWRKNKPELHKIPAIFLMYSGI